MYTLGGLGDNWFGPLLPGQLPWAVGNKSPPYGGPLLLRWQNWRGTELQLRVVARPAEKDNKNIYISKDISIFCSTFFILVLNKIKDSTTRQETKSSIYFTGLVQVHTTMYWAETFCWWCCTTPGERPLLAHVGAITSSMCTIPPLYVDSCVVLKSKEAMTIIVCERTGLLPITNVNSWYARKKGYLLSS